MDNKNKNISSTHITVSHSGEGFELRGYVRHNETVCGLELTAFCTKCDQAKTNATSILCLMRKGLPSLPLLSGVCSLCW